MFQIFLKDMFDSGFLTELLVLFFVSKEFFRFLQRLRRFLSSQLRCGPLFPSSFLLHPRVHPRRSPGDAGTRVDRPMDVRRPGVPQRLRTDVDSGSPGGETKDVLVPSSRSARGTPGFHSTAGVGLLLGPRRDVSRAFDKETKEVSQSHVSSGPPKTSATPTPPRAEWTRRGSFRRSGRSGRHR